MGLAIVSDFPAWENAAMRGIYLHIPFCVRKCAYCDFYSVPSRDESTLDAFVSAVVAEADAFRSAFPLCVSEPSDTVYFGGGTPTLLGPDRLVFLLAALRDRFPVIDGAEVTTEANPGTVDEAGLAVLRAGGFTRLSLGVQSFDPATLQTLGRIHGEEEVRAAYRAARGAKFPSVGLDLIYGNPGQTLDAWRKDVAKAASFLPDHISAYAMTPGDGTPLERAVDAGTLSLPEPDDVATMYDDARADFARIGYRHYEISNFARPGHASRHNMKYWTREGYVGLGPSAHGFLLGGEMPAYGRRTGNPPSFDEWRASVASGRMAWTGADSYEATRDDAWKETFIFGLRTADGVDLAAAGRAYGPMPEELRATVDALVAQGTLVATKENGGETLRLPPDLWSISNEVLWRFA